MKKLLEITCIDCREVIKLEVEATDHLHWKQGELVQVAFPYLSPANRELLISGLCGKCFSKLFKKGS